MLKHISLFGKLMSFFIFLLPFIFSTQLFYGSVNAKYFFVTFSITILALIFGYMVFTGKHQVRKVGGRWLLLIASLFLLMLYTTSYTGIFFERSLWGDILRSTGIFFLSYVCALGYFASEMFSKKDWILLRRSIILSGVLFALGTFVGFDRYFFSNTTFVGSFLFLSIALTVLEILLSKGSERTLFGIGLLIQLFSPIIFSATELMGSARSSSVAAWAFVIYALGLVALQRIKKEHIAWLWNGVWLVVMTVSLSLLFTPGTFIQEKYIDLSSGARIIIWEQGIEAFKEKPLLGWGPENFRTAFIRHFDNRLHLDENIGEVWFDRGHNVFVDGLVAFGVLGVAVVTILLLRFFYVLYRARKENLIEFFEMHLLGALMVGHLLQLQTSFNTSVTYIILALILGYGVWLERKLFHVEAVYSENIRKGIAVILLLLTFVGGYYFVCLEFVRQYTLMNIFRSTTNAEQVERINRGLARSSDFEGLRISSASMLKGLFTQLEGQNDQTKVTTIVSAGLSQMSAYEKAYNEYLAEQPDDYRVRMNYAYLLVMKSALGEDNLEEAGRIIEGSYELSPENPLTYAVHSMQKLFNGDLQGAAETINAGVALNPEIEFTRDVRIYIEEQIRKAPRIGVLKMENL